MSLITWVAIAATVIIAAAIFYGIGKSQSSKKIENNDSKPELEHAKFVRIFHLEARGSYECHYPENCDLPKVVHYTGLLSEETVLQWMDWREEEMSREAKLADIRGKNSWHLEEGVVRPCYNYLRQSNCDIPETRHFDSYKKALDKAKSNDWDWDEYNLFNVTPLYGRGSRFTTLFLKLHNDRILKENGHQIVHYEPQSSVQLDVEETVENPETVVKQIKLEIGELRSNICWVIDNPAFFDNNSPVSSDMFLKLAEWDDNYATWDFQKKSEASVIIQEMFETAKQGAIELGFDYLHGNTRKNMEKASNLARKALSTTHVAEQASIMEKVAEILAGVLGVSIPNRTVKAVEEYSKKAIH